MYYLHRIQASGIYFEKNQNLKNYFLKELNIRMRNQADFFITVQINAV